MSQLYQNTAILKGYIANDPLVKEKVVRFTISTTKEFIKDGETKKITSYVPCVAFGHEANIAKKLGKGDLVTAICSIAQNSYTDKEDKKIYTTNITVESLALNKKAETKEEEAAAPDIDNDVEFNEGNAPF